MSDMLKRSKGCAREQIWEQKVDKFDRFPDVATYRSSNKLVIGLVPETETHKENESPISKSMKKRNTFD